MMIDCTLKDVATSIQTGPFGSQLHSSDYSEEGTPVVMPQDIVDGQTTDIKIARVDDSHVERLARHKLKQGEIVYPRRGNLAKCAFITPNEENWLCGTGCLKVTIDTSKANPKYIYFHLQLPDSVSCIENATIGSTMPNLNTGILGNVRLKLPNIDIQNKIVDILSLYDELIAINRKKIKVLEEMAMRTYREWFVYMRFPGYEHTPKVDGLPQGWQCLAISDMLSSYIGGGWGEEDASEKFCKPAFVIRGSDIPSILQGIPNYDIYRYHSKSNLKSRKLNSEDIIFEISGGSDSQPLGRNCIITNSLLHSYGGDVICASFCKRLVPKQDMSFFLYTYLQQIYRMGLLDTFCVRTTGISNFKFEAFIKFQKVVVPSNELLISFNKIASPIYEEISTIGNQICHISKMRDKLLPQLMRGKLEIKA